MEGTMDSCEWHLTEREKEELLKKQKGNNSALINWLDAGSQEKRLFDFPLKTMTDREQQMLNDGTCTGCGATNQLRPAADNEHFSAKQCDVCKTVFMMKPNASI
jgi:hypothetical protein